MKDKGEEIERKHAYLIIAHNKFEQLKILLKLLDHKNHDFFIHIDKKAVDFDENDIRKVVEYSNVIFTKRIKVTWGGYSQIRCELLLLKEATAYGNYEYYHLLSGVDLPIKKSDDIYNFFHSNSGKNFITIDKEFQSIDRVRYYYFFQEKIGRQTGFLRRFQSRLLSLQKLFKINRCKRKNIKWKKGANWFSITNDLARYVLEKEKWIKKNFNKTRCADEIFLQTIVANSKFNDTLFFNENGDTEHMRYIDWTRSVNAGPHTFRLEDFDRIISSNCMFARKFDIDVDKRIIEKIRQNIS